MEKWKISKRIAFKFTAMALSVFFFYGYFESDGKNAIALESPSFVHQKSIPSQFTCDGPNVSPSLAWKNIPGKAKSIALICDDPDAPAGVWVHWVVYDMPATATSLPEGIAKSDSLPMGGKQGITDFGEIGYGGPCPPSGAHRYFFKIYALDRMLGLPGGKTKKDIEQAMKGHILTQGQLIGIYSRKK